MNDVENKNEKIEDNGILEEQKMEKYIIEIKNEEKLENQEKMTKRINLGKGEGKGEVKIK
jgi:hypothetical protein